MKKQTQLNIGFIIAAYFIGRILLTLIFNI
jgi:hypothetical protein